MFKKIALLLGLMTSMLFSVSALAAVNAADPYALVDQAAQQTRGQDGEGAGFGELTGTLLHLQGDDGHLALGIQRDVADSTDDDAADLDRRAHFQAADIIEMGAQGIGFSFRFETQSRHLQCQRQNGCDASQHEGTDQEFYFAELHLSLIQT